MKWLRLIKLLPRLSAAAEQLQTKGWYASRTIWVNLITLAGAILAAVTGVQVLSSDEAASIAVGIVAAVNIVLRFLTGRPVGLHGVPGSAGAGHDKSVSDKDDHGP